MKRDMVKIEIEFKGYITFVIPEDEFDQPSDERVAHIIETIINNDLQNADGKGSCKIEIIDSTASTI